MQKVKTVSSKTCVDTLIKWTTENYDSLPKGDWNFVGEKRLTVLKNGHTRTSNWKRRAIKKDSTRVYRLFECNECMFTSRLMFLVVEDNADINYTHVMAGTREEFKHHFNKVGWSWGSWD